MQSIGEQWILLTKNSNANVLSFDISMFKRICLNLLAQAPCLHVCFMMSWKNKNAEISFFYICMEMTFSICFLYVLLRSGILTAQQRKYLHTNKAKTQLFMTFSDSRVISDFSFDKVFLEIHHHYSLQREVFFPRNHLKISFAKLYPFNSGFTVLNSLHYNDRHQYKFPWKISPQRFPWCETLQFL